MIIPDLKNLLLNTEMIARHAGAEIMKHYSGTNIYTKDDGSYVTDADHAAENIILPALRKITPDIPVLSEERAAAGDIPDISGGTFWAVDPLDGTQEFINKTDAFVVAIGLIAAGKPVMGIIYHPSLNLMYSAAGAGTASKVLPDGTRTLLVPAAGHSPALLASRQHDDMARIKTWLDRRYAGTPVRINTSSGVFRACRVAEGTAGISVAFTQKPQSRVAFWDAAAGQAIVESAGGLVETMDDQKPLVYDAPDLHVPAHAAFSSWARLKIL